MFVYVEQSSDLSSLSCSCWGVGMLLVRFGGAPVRELVAVHLIRSLALSLSLSLSARWVDVVL
jgi:hypothetical protein